MTQNIEHEEKHDGISKKIKVLHVTPDDKFFDRFYAAWERDSRFENNAILISDDKPYRFKYIKSESKIKVVSSKEAKQFFKNSEYDIFFFLSLPSTRYKYVSMIPKNKIVIWWAWGYDIYEKGGGGLPPVVKLDLLKPLTKKICADMSGKLFVHNAIRFFPKLLLKPFLLWERNKAINRVDYFQPVIRGEIDLMSEKKYFRAGEFYYKSRTLPESSSTKSKSSGGNILLGNSSSLTNNHLDVFQQIRPYVSDDQRIIVPMNYGDELYRNEISPRIIGDNVDILTEFLSRDEYWNLVEGCSYACYGVIRQQAMGNINYCIKNGIKVFLYRDSIIYKFYKEMGFIIYAIEDIDDESFNVPMSRMQNEYNLAVFEKEFQRRDGIYEEVIGGLMKKFGKKCLNLHDAVL